MSDTQESLVLNEPLNCSLSAPLSENGDENPPSRQQAAITHSLVPIETRIHPTHEREFSASGPSRVLADDGGKHTRLVVVASILQSIPSGG